MISLVLIKTLWKRDHNSFLQMNKPRLRRRQWQATPVLLPRKSHGWRSLVGCSPWGRYESDATERLHFHFSLSHNGEGNDNHSRVLAWRIPGMGEPGGLPSMGSLWVGHNWSDLAAAAAANQGSEKWDCQSHRQVLEDYLVFKPGF